MEVTIASRTVLRVLFLVFATILFLGFLQKIGSALLLIFVAFFLALALNGPVQWVSRHLPGRFHGQRSTATALSFLVVMLLLGGFVASIVPPLIEQTESFIDSAPRLIEDSRNQDSELGSFIRRYHLEGQVETFSEQLGDRLRNAGGAAFTGVGKVGSSIFSVLTIIVLTFMMLTEGPHIMKYLRGLLPARRRNVADRLAPAMYRVIKGFVNGQVALAAIAAVLIGPAFFILGVSYPVALMVVVFISGLIPMVGHFIGATIVTLVALSASPIAALIVLGYYILYQQIENYIIQPKVQANTTNLSPLLVFSSVVIGVAYGGLLGGLFAIPIAGCLKVLLLDYMRNHDYISDPAIAHDAQPEVQAAKADPK